MSKALALVFVLVAGMTGCDNMTRKAVGQVVPVPELMWWEPVYQPFGDNEARVRIRNTGASGHVRITVTDNGQTWTSRKHFNAGEERTVTLRLTGCANFSGGSMTCGLSPD